jgi:hypothetical protein
MRKSIETIQACLGTFVQEGDREVLVDQVKQELKADAVTVFRIGKDANGFESRVSIKPSPNGRRYTWAVLGQVDVADNQWETEERFRTDGVFVTIDNPANNQRISIIGDGLKL